MRLLSRRKFLSFVPAAWPCLAQTPARKGRRMPELRVLTKLEQVGGLLVLSYGVDNQTNRDVYLLNRVHDQSLRTSPDLVYVEFNREQRLVSAYKKIPAIPPGLSPTMPAAPYVTPLRAGKRFMESIRIELPVREFSAYAPAPEKTRAAHYRGLIFTLGYYWSVPGMKERTLEIVPGVEAITTLAPPGTQLEFGETVSDVMQFDIPVMEPI